MGNIKKTIEEIEKEIKSEKITGDKKDQLSDQLDKVGDEVDNLNDQEELSDSEATVLKDKISKVKNELD